MLRSVQVASEIEPYLQTLHQTWYQTWSVRQILLTVAIGASNGLYLRKVVTGDPSTIVEIELNPWEGWAPPWHIPNSPFPLLVPLADILPPIKRSLSAPFLTFLLSPPIFTFLFYFLSKVRSLSWWVHHVGYHVRWSCQFSFSKSRGQGAMSQGTNGGFFFLGVLVCWGL